jgi:hypothetical protein
VVIAKILHEFVIYLCVVLEAKSHLCIVSTNVKIMQILRTDRLTLLGDEKPKSTRLGATT